MATIFVITSGKGGVGKTTTAINLGSAINALGGDVTIVDANLTTPNIGLYLGAPIAPITLNHVLRDEAAIHEAIYQHESGTKIIPSDISIRELKKINLKKLKSAIKELKNLSDYIILDSPAGLGEDALTTIDSADEIIVVTNPEIPAITDALKTIKLAEEKGKKIKGVILTRHKRQKTEMSISSIREMLEIPILGIIPEDKKMQESLALKNAIFYTHPKSKSALAYKNIARKILGLPEEKPGFFKKLFG